MLLNSDGHLNSDQMGVFWGRGPSFVFQSVGWKKRAGLEIASKPLIVGQFQSAAIKKIAIVGNNSMGGIFRSIFKIVGLKTLAEVDYLT